MNPTPRAARLTGLLYLVVVLAGPFVLLYVPGKLFVRGDAAATAVRILEHETLFRTSIVVGAVSQLFFVAAALALYRLLRSVQAEVAAAMAILILIPAPLAVAGTANEIATLALLEGGDFLAAFEPAQRQALALLLLEFDRLGVYAAELYWGLWLLPLGWLVGRSRFLPKAIGFWLAGNGVAYVAIAASGMVAPQRAAAVMTYATPLLFGEVALTLWLLIFGVRAPAATRLA
jgi:hypothetical protein